MGTLFVGAIVVLIVAAIIRSMIKDKKAGKPFSVVWDANTVEATVIITVIESCR